MAESATNGAAALDLSAVQTALMSSSTTTRHSQLREIDERITRDGVCNFMGSKRDAIGHGHATLLTPSLLRRSGSLRSISTAQDPLLDT